MSADLSTIYALDLMGELLMMTLLVCNVWRLRGHTREDRLLRVLVFCTMLGCLADATSFSSDGMPGALGRTLVVASNTFLYASGVILCSCWALLIHLHLRGSVTRSREFLLGIPVAICLALLAVNLWVPLVFSVDAANVYSRLPLSRLLMGFPYAYFLYALVLYARVHRSNGGLRLFPGWALLLPVAVGGSVQVFVPTVPLFWPTVSVGIAGTIASLQNEDIYRDRLTGLYSRAYLERLASGELRRDDAGMTGIMIDLNAFKSINDRYGHNVGDQALVDAARLVRGAVGDIGMTARYAGDEFVVLLNTRNEAVVRRTMDEIRDSFRRFDEDGKRPYRLSASLGQRPLEPGRQSMEEFISSIDSAMYEDKRRYYDEHPEASRRGVRDGASGDGAQAASR